MTRTLSDVAPEWINAVAKEIGISYGTSEETIRTVMELRPAAALAQPEPVDVRAAFESHFGAIPKGCVWNGRGFSLTAFNAWEATNYANKFEGFAATWGVAPPAPAPIRCNSTRLEGDPTLPNSTELDQLRKELANMTAQRDSWIALMDIAREVYDTTAAKALADMNAADIDADRMDAQIWRFFLTAQDETTPEHAAIVSAADGLFPVSDLSKVMEIAMTGGQP
jgi:hypothetical protein